MKEYDKVISALTKEKNVLSEKLEKSVQSEENLKKCCAEKDEELAKGKHELQALRVFFKHSFFFLRLLFP